MLDQEKIESDIGAFAQTVVDIARRNLKVKSTTNFRGERWKSTKKPRRIEASGKTSKSLGYKLKVNANSYELGMTGAPETEFVERGRRPGRMPPLKSIRDWVQAKKVKPYVTTKAGGRKFVSKTPRRVKMMSYLIARKIGKEGTQATYFYEAAVLEALKKHSNIIEDGIAANVEATATQILKQLENGFSSSN